MHQDFQWNEYFKQNLPLFIGVCLLLLLAVLDFYDLGLWRSAGIFYRHESEPFITFLVGLPLVLTLWEAFRANYETQRQTGLQLRPFLRMQWTKGHATVRVQRASNDFEPEEHIEMFDKIILVNEGSGVAVNVEFAPFGTQDPPTAFINFRTVTAMSARGGVTTLQLKHKDHNTSMLNPTKQGDKPYQVRVRYSDLEGRRYEQVFESSSDHNDGYKVVRW